MWTPNRRTLSFNSEDGLPNEGDESKKCDLSLLSEISKGTSKTTELSPFSFGSVTTTPPKSPSTARSSSISPIPKTDLDLRIAFDGSDKCTFAPSKRLPILKIKRTSNIELEQGVTYRLPFALRFSQKRCGSTSSFPGCEKEIPRRTLHTKSLRHYLSSRMYKRLLGMKSLGVFMLSIATCSVVISNNRLTLYTNYDNNSFWEIKATNFRATPLHYFTRRPHRPRDVSLESAALHTLVSGYRPIHRTNTVEHRFGKLNWDRGIGNLDPGMYETELIPPSSLYRNPRIFKMHTDREAYPDGNNIDRFVKRNIELYPAVFSDNTQLYGIRSSDDEALSKMETGNIHNCGECVPMKDWQMAYHPSCNEIHSLDMKNSDENEMGMRISLLGTKGYWRNVWKVETKLKGDIFNKKERLVLKTLKYNHNFEHAQYERDRIDAITMDRLTASPYVVDIYGFCGRSVLNEFADGPGLGKLADKSRKYPLKRLEIARDIASGLADVHGVDGNGENSTIVHMDINPANVVVVKNRLKLNDFNIAVMLKWNRTSSTQCGFPSQYPNPQWRSPEEAGKSQHLTEKIDVFSMGHIFFRMICGHEPWNKLEIGGRPAANEITEKVKNGTLPRIPEKIKQTKDPEIKAILAAMMACYTKEPTKRPSARAIADFLEKKLKGLSSNNQGRTLH